MHNRDEIEAIVDNRYEDTCRFVGSFASCIRELFKARSRLENGADASGYFALEVIHILSVVKSDLVEYTELRQEEEIETAIELATGKLLEHEGPPDSDTESVQRFHEERRQLFIAGRRYTHF